MYLYSIALLYSTQADEMQHTLFSIQIFHVHPYYLP